MVARAKAAPAAAMLIEIALLASCGGGGGGSSLPSLTPAPMVALSPANLAFPSQDVGTSSSPQPVTLSNSGNAALSVTGIALSGANAGDFAQMNNCGSSVAAGAGCTINVIFTPSAPGARSASLVITDNAAGSPQSVSLTGTGVAPVVVSISPKSATVETGATQQFTATVTGTSSTAVTWSVNGTTGGNATAGTISTGGLYTAPTSVPNPSTVTVAATSVADPAQQATATVTITKPTSATVTGTVAISPVAGSTVTAFALNSDGTKGAPLGSSTTAGDGSYSLTMAPAPTGPFLLVATGGSYVDEVTGAFVNLGGSRQLSAAVPAGVTPVAVTPLTSMATARASALASAGVSLATAVGSSYIGVDQQYQLLDLPGGPPATANSAAQVQGTVTGQRIYGLVLAGIMQEASTLGVQAIDLATALATDASDGTLDGMNAGAAITVPTTLGGSITLSPTAGLSDLQNAINAFRSSPNNKTNIDSVSILTRSVQIGVNTGFNAFFYPDTPTLPGGVSGKSYAVTLQATGGSPPYTCSLANGSILPPGFALTPECVLTGMAPALPPGVPMEILPGPFTVVFSDSASPPNTAQFSYFITVFEVPPMLHALSPSISCPSAAPVPFVTASGGDPPYFFGPELSLNELGTPVELSVNSDGTVSCSAPPPGASVAPGTYDLGVFVVDLIGQPASGAEPVTVIQPASFSVGVNLGFFSTGSGTVVSNPPGINCFLSPPQVTSGVCNANFPSGTNVALTATPAPGSFFNGWSAPCTGTGTCNVNMNNTTLIFVDFELLPP